VEPIGTYITQIEQALSEEIKARNAFPKKSILTNGARITVSAESAVYRFEIPESFLFEPSMTVQCAIGAKLPLSFPSVIADVHHQFIFFLVPIDLGETISEMTCEWNPSETLERLSKRYGTFQQRNIVTSLFNRDFSENAHPAAKEPIFPSSFTDSQRDAVKKSIGRKISFIIGERKRGKTGVAASLLFSSLREGKRALYLTSSSGNLYKCMNEVVSLNPVVAEESIAVFDSGIRLLPQLPMPVYSAQRSNGSADEEGLKKLIKVIASEYEYDRVDGLMQKLHEKQRQVHEASKEAEDIKAELTRLQNASMIERMKQRINKADIDYIQSQYQNKLALVERLKQQAAAFAKEQFKKESQLPVQLKEKKALEKLASTQLSLQPSTSSALSRCIAATVYQALTMEPEQLGEFDVVCIDDAHALNLSEFFWCASLAKEQCFIFADITEQLPQSVSQLEQARSWLQKNYFTYFQQGNEEQRFTLRMLPPDTASELLPSEQGITLFEAALINAIDQTPVPPGAKGKIYFINTEDQHSVSAQYLGKKKILPFNEANAKRVIECVKHALMGGNITQSDILIVTPPSGQSMYLRELLKANRMNDIEIASLGSIRLCAKRSVIFDTTVAGIDFTLRLLDDKKSGTVRIADTFNTLLSTMREDFYVITDLSHFTTRYKDRFITKLLNVFSKHSENPANVSNMARRFDDLPIELQMKVLSASANEKLSADYTTKIEQSKPTALDAMKSALQQTVASAERRLKSDAHAAILRVLAKREIVNSIAQYLEAYPLYKTTQETQKYYSALVDAGCENENDFKNVMDMWNLLIYETSNANKTNHPLAAKAKVDSKIASDLQQIYVYYHSELEMVVEEGKHKLAQSIQKIFNDCIGKKPVTPTDWMNAYLVFLGRMEKYLDAVINQIRT